MGRQFLLWKVQVYWTAVDAIKKGGSVSSSACRENMPDSVHVSAAKQRSSRSVPDVTGVGLRAHFAAQCGLRWFGLVLWPVLLGHSRCYPTRMPTSRSRHQHMMSTRKTRTADTRWHFGRRLSVNCTCGP